MFLTTGSVRADATVESVQILTELLDPGRVTFTEEEVRAGVDFLAGTAPGRYATADAIAGEAVSLVMDRLPLDFTTSNREATLALTAEELTDAYAALAPERWCVIVVGDAAEIADGLQGLGIGPVTVVPS